MAQDLAADDAYDITPMIAADGTALTLTGDLIELLTATDSPIRTIPTRESSSPLVGRQPGLAPVELIAPGR